MAEALLWEVYPELYVVLGDKARELEARIQQVPGVVEGAQQ